MYKGKWGICVCKPQPCTHNTPTHVPVSSLLLGEGEGRGRETGKGEGIGRWGQMNNAAVSQCSVSQASSKKKAGLSAKGLCTPEQKIRRVHIYMSRSLQEHVCIGLLQGEVSPPPLTYAAYKNTCPTNQKGRQRGQTTSLMVGWEEEARLLGKLCVGVGNSGAGGSEKQAGRTKRQQTPIHRLKALLAYAA